MVLWNASRRTYSSRLTARPYPTGASCSTGPRLRTPDRPGAPVTPGAGIYRVPAVLPGLWDCHAHFMGMFSPDLAELATNAPALTAMRVARDAAVALPCRIYERPRGRRTWGLGIPRGSGGHGQGPQRVRGRSDPQPDRWSCRPAHVPVDWVCDLADRIGMLRQCDGVPECLRAVRLQLAREPG